MEIISWKKEFYFVRYSISKLGIFLELFWNFLGTFLILSIFTKNATLIFEVEIYRNVSPIFKKFEGKNLQKCPSEFLSSKFTEMALYTILINAFDFSKLRS